MATIATTTEEQQAREFLKRAEIRTMKKDLRALRELDALKERDKIVKIKTLEEQLAEQKQKIEAGTQSAQIPVPVPKKEYQAVKQVMLRGEQNEREAEKDLKQYATEEERQQIFLFESQRIELENQVDAIDKQKDPALRLDKNKLLIEKGNWDKKLSEISAEEKKLEDEQKFIAEKAQSSTIPQEKQSLEKSRWEIEEKIKQTEKRRWEAEKQIQDLEAKIGQIDKSLSLLVDEKNSLQDRVLGIDRSLRDVYSGVMARVEEKRRLEKEQLTASQQASAKARAQQREQIQRQQYAKTEVQQPDAKKEYMNKIPVPVRKKLEKSFEAEEQQRKQFLKDVETWSNTGEKNSNQK